MSGIKLNTSVCISLKSLNALTQLEIPNQSQFFNSSVTVCALTVGFRLSNYTREGLYASPRTTNVRRRFLLQATTQ